MRLDELKRKIPNQIVGRHVLSALFPNEKAKSTNIQLSRFAHNGNVVRICRGLYALADTKVDEFYLANLILSPSYVSLESALNTYGIIPDIPLNVTSVTPNNTKTAKTPFGGFLYSKINKRLYFGYEKVKSPLSGYYYDMATPEKALLDYIYIRKIKDPSSSRIDMKSLRKQLIFRQSREFPSWVLTRLQKLYDCK